MRRLHFPISVVVACLCLTALAAADAIFTQSLQPQPNEQSVTFANIAQQNAALSASVLGQLASGGVVLFTTTPNDLNGHDVLFIDPFGAPANSVGTRDGSLNNLTISAPSATFTDMMGNLFGVFPCTQVSVIRACQPLLITVFFSDGSHQVFTFVNPNLDIAGDNDFTIVANPGFHISSITIGGLTDDDEARFYALANISLSGVAAQQTVPSVPEPGSLALLGTGLTAAAAFTRRRRIGPALCRTRRVGADRYPNREVPGTGAAGKKEGRLNQRLSQGASPRRD